MSYSNSCGILQRPSLLWINHIMYFLAFQRAHASTFVHLHGFNFLFRKKKCGESSWSSCPWKLFQVETINIGFIGHWGRTKTTTKIEHTEEFLRELLKEVIRHIQPSWCFLYCPQIWLENTSVFRWAEMLLSKRDGGFHPGQSLGGHSAFVFFLLQVETTLLWKGDTG